MLFIAVPNAQAKSLKGLFFEQNKEQTFPKLMVGQEIHLSQFTSETLSKLLKSVGFSIIEFGIDDHHPKPNYKSALKYYLYLCIYILTKQNFSPTIFMIVRK